MVIILFGGVFTGAFLFINSLRISALQRIVEAQEKTKQVLPLVNRRLNEMTYVVVRKMQDPNVLDEQIQRELDSAEPQP